MSYLISTEIKGFKYYARIISTTSYQWMGVVNNATKFSNVELAEPFKKEIAKKTTTVVKLISK